MTHTCFTCKVEKPLNAFAPRNHKYSKLGIHGTCRECQNTRRRAVHTKGADKAVNLKIRFGMTLAEYDALFKEQQGCCAICEAPQTGLNKNLAVDHCHSTMVIRGLLCDNCNRALGQFKDNPTILTNAFNYLTKERPSAKIIPITARPDAYRKKGTKCP